MADFINNQPATDRYTSVGALSLGPDFQAKSAVITIANEAALMQFAVGETGNWHWTDEREYFTPPQSFKVSNVIGVRFRNAQPGVVARVLCILSTDSKDEPHFDTGVPFTGVLSASGGITPGGGSVEIDHNGLAISTEPKVDFEDGPAGSFAWSIVDDPINTRAVITPIAPKIAPVCAGIIAANGTILVPSGIAFTCVRTGVGQYTITLATGVPTPITLVSPWAQSIVSSIDAASTTVFHVTMTTPAAFVDAEFNFMVFSLSA